MTDSGNLNVPILKSLSKSPTTRKMLGNKQIKRTNLPELSKSIDTVFEAHRTNYPSSINTLQQNQEGVGFLS